MAFPGASRPLLCGSVGIGSIVLLLKPMPPAELVLVPEVTMYPIILQTEQKQGWSRSS
jgi:hypothetical protein